MLNFKNRFKKINTTHWQVVGVLLLVLLAVFLLWFNNITSMQSTDALMAEVYFDGEYRIGSGE